jgi:hypothetical protein
MQATLNHPAFDVNSDLFKPAFKLFIACEDHAALSQARKVQRQVQALCGGEVEIAPVFWSFSLLRSPELRIHAAREIAAAEMIIVALDENGELPAHVKDLLESLPALPQSGQPALVALIGQGAKSTGQLNTSVPYLRGIARHHGLDFFCNRDDWERLGAPVAKPAAVIHHDLPRRAWGAN